MTALNAPHFSDETEARKYLEAIRWPNGPVCPHCGVEGGHYALKAKTEGSKTAARPGLYKCADCRKQFSVTVGTVFERSKVPLTKWLLAAYLLTSSKKGMSAHQLHRTLGVTYKTAWFLAHRIREAMIVAPTGLMGSGGGTVEADETYIGIKKGAKKDKGWGHKQQVFALVERGGKAHAMHVPGGIFAGIKAGLEHVAEDAHLMTDEARMYRNVAKRFASHSTVNHSKYEFRRGSAHTNTIEGYFSIFKRGMKGVYQHCSEDHLQRYLTEFSFRYNHRSSLGVEDGQRFRDALAGIEGKRLTYRTASRPTS